MTSPEVAAYFNAMTQNMGNKLNQYQYNLQCRYGDPRVYAMQQQQMREDEMRVIHSRKQRTAELLQSAYAERTQKNREAHAARMAKRQGGHTVASPQESDQPRPAGRNPAPRKRVAPPPPTATPSAA